MVVCLGSIRGDLLAANASEEVVSILMSEDEEKTYSTKNVPKEDDKEEKEPLAVPQNKSYQIQAIVFHSPTQWTVWVDGKSYSAGQARISTSLHIKAVSGQSVEITEDDIVTLLFTGQSYQGKN